MEKYPEDVPGFEGEDEKLDSLRGNILTGLRDCYGEPTKEEDGYHLNMEVA